MPFYHAKGHLLHRKRAPFANLFVTFWICDGYKVKNESFSLILQ